jgi:spectinomycin phosphotransferase
VRALPDDFDAGALVGALAGGWGFDVETLEYAPVGGGSHHWLASDGSGTRGFVTVDDLDQKPWLGETRESVFEGLGRAFETAVALRESGLGFVVAPLLTRRGETALRLGPRHTAALFPFVDGRPGRFGHYDAVERAPILAMLAELHQATPAVASVVRRADLDLAGRPGLEKALQGLRRTWTGGPFSEPARLALARHASDVADLLALADRLAAEVATHITNWVVTHGEPHGGNVVRTGAGYVLIDWDTVALAPLERDLWMLVGDGADDVAVYTDLTGHELDESAVNFFRLAWDLEDLAAFTSVLHSPHRHSADTVRAYEGVTACVAIRDRWAALLD